MAELASPVFADNPLAALSIAREFQALPDPKEVFLTQFREQGRPVSIAIRRGDRVFCRALRWGRLFVFLPSFPDPDDTIEHSLVMLYRRVRHWDGDRFRSGTFYLVPRDGFPSQQVTLVEVRDRVGWVRVGEISGPRTVKEFMSLWNRGHHADESGVCR